MFVADWDKQDKTPILRAYIISVNNAKQTVTAIVDRKLVFNIPANQITWDHWANG